MKLAVCLTLLAVCAGCSNLVIGPENVADPVSIYLLDEGRHPTLVLPAGDGTFVRYAYGDWRWYALSDTSTSAGIAALLWPTPGALGRKQLSAAQAKPQTLIERYRVENFYTIRVERAAANRLRTRLDALFAAGQRAEHYNSAADLYFVHDPESYTALNNCNHVMSRWLEELGCRVSGFRMLSIWEMGDAQGQSPPATAPATQPP